MNNKIENMKNKGIITYVVTYNNAKVNKYSIIKENRNKSGIYIWVNNINGKSYIGSSINLGNKFNIYYSLSSLKKIKKLIIMYRALLKYGHSNFSLNIIEYCESNALIAKEQYYIDLIKPKYNIKKKDS